MSYKKPTLKNEVFNGQTFYERDNIADRCYINSQDKIVLIWKSKQEMKTEGIEPDRIITIKQFKIEYGRFMK